MSDVRGPLPPARARPIAEPFVDQLAGRAEELARRWAIALIVARPLEGIGGVPLEELARSAPSLCAQALRALESDLELDRLTGSPARSAREQSAPARSLASIAGASDAAGLVLATEALRGVLWEGLLEHVRASEYGEAPSRRLADAGDRLAYVCARILLAALEAELPEPQGRAAEAPPASVRRPRAHAQDASRAVLVDERAEAPRRPGQSVVDERAEGAHRPGQSVVDERVQPAHRPERSLLDEHAQAGRRPRQSEPSPAGVARIAPTYAPVEEPRWEQPRGDDQPREEIEIHDARVGPSPGAWIATIARQLERLREDGLPFGVLLVEPLHLDALRLGEPSTELLRVAGEIEDALAVALRGGPALRTAARGLHVAGGRSLTRERPGRYWLLAPEADRAGVERLAERLRSAVASVVEYRGVPVEIVIGTSVCPDDGLQASGLAAHADVGLYAARSARARGLRGSIIDETAER